MGVFDKVLGEFRRMSNPEDEDDFEEFDPIEPRNPERRERRTPRSERSYEPGESKRTSGGKRENSIVELRTNTLQRVVVMEPKEYEEVKSIADYLCDKHTIFLNLEQTDVDVSRRILDFISGVAYANEGAVRRVADKTYVVTPFTVTLIDSLMDGLEHEGIFFKT